VFEKDKTEHDDFDGELLIFEIFLNVKNEMATSIDLRFKDFSHLASEEEVLLMPMFTFQVTKITRPEEKKEIKISKGNTITAKVTTITLV